MCMQITCAEINSAKWADKKKKIDHWPIWPLLTSSHFINLLPFLRLSGTDTGLSCSAWTPGCAPAIGSSTLLNAQAGGRNESLHSPLLLCLFLSFVICLKAGWRKPTTDASMSCPQWRRRRWRVPALESCGGGRRRSGPRPLTDWLTGWATCSWRRGQRKREKEGDRARERESSGEGGSIWMSYTSDIKLYKSMQGQDRCSKWSGASLRSWQYDGHSLAPELETNSKPAVWKMLSNSRCVQQWPTWNSWIMHNQVRSTME